MGYRRDIETSVKMRIYALKKRHFFIIILCFILIILISSIAGLTGPSVLNRVNLYGSNLLKDRRRISSGPFIIEASSTSLYQRELWLSAILHRKSDIAGLSISFNNSLKVSCKSSEISLPKSDGSVRLYSQSRVLKCSEKACSEFLIIHLAELGCSIYTFEVSFNSLLSGDHHKIRNPENDETLTGALDIGVVEVEFILQTYNSHFGYFELFSRFSATVATFFLIIYYSLAMRKFSCSTWTIEQFWTAVLLPHLLLFYNPFHPMIYLVKSWIFEACDNLFQINYLCILLLFWLCFYHGIRATSRSRCRYYSPKFVLVGCTWLMLIYFVCRNVYLDYATPLFDISGSRVQFIAFFVLLGILSFIYLLYLLVLMIRTYSELHSLPYFGLRFSFLTVPTFFLNVGLGFAIGQRFSLSFPPSYKPVSTDFLDESRNATYFTLSSIPSTKFRSSFELAFSFGLLFAYMLLFVIGYSPATNASIEANYKDNPALSMVNESDEDVLFGSDHEDLQLQSLRHR